MRHDWNSLIETGRPAADHASLIAWLVGAIRNKTTACSFSPRSCFLDQVFGLSCFLLACMPDIARKGACGVGGDHAAELRRNGASITECHERCYQRCSES